MLLQILVFLMRLFSFGISVIGYWDVFVGCMVESPCLRIIAVSGCSLQGVALIGVVFVLIFLINFGFLALQECDCRASLRFCLFFLLSCNM